MMMTTGSPTFIQSKNPGVSAIIPLSTKRSAWARKTALGGVPIGVAIPPMLAA